MVAWPWWWQKDTMRTDSEYLLQVEVTDVLRLAVEGERSGASEGPKVLALRGRKDAAADNWDRGQCRRTWWGR